MFGFGLPAISYLVLLSHYQVNAVLGDQWDDAATIRQSYAHFPDWSSLWSQHTDNRLFFPNLIVLALARTVAFNIEVEEFLSALMLFGAVALVIWAHRRRSPGIPFLCYCPVAFLMLTFAQWQNTLWGFQMAWYLVLLSLAASIAWLDRISLTWPAWTAAVFAAVVGSYSSVQGFLIWPVGMLLIYYRRRSWTIAVSWVFAAGATTALFLHNYTGQPSNVRFVTQFPVLLLKFFVYALGAVVGAGETSQAPNGAVMALGTIILVLALLVLAMWGLHRDPDSGVPIGVVLIVFGLLFDALITDGRFIFGFLGAAQSRYTTYDVLVLVGLYLTTLTQAFQDRSERPFRNPTGRRRAAVAVTWIRSHAYLFARGLLVIVLVITIVQVAFSVHYGLQGAERQHQLAVKTATVTRNFDHESNGAVRALYPYHSADWVRVEALFLRDHHLSLFG